MAEYWTLSPMPMTFQQTSTGKDGLGSYTLIFLLHRTNGDMWQRLQAWILNEICNVKGIRLNTSLMTEDDQSLMVHSHTRKLCWDGMEWAALVTQCISMEVFTHWVTSAAHPIPSQHACGCTIRQGTEADRYVTCVWHTCYISSQCVTCQLKFFVGSLQISREFATEYTHSCLHTHT